MDKLIPTLEVVMPVIIAVCIGMLLRKKNLLSEQGVADIKGLIVNICIPSLSFGTFYAADLSGTVAVLIIIMLIAMIAAYFIGILLERVLHMNQPFMPYLCTTIEGGMLGYALYILLFGQENLYHMALIDLGTALFLFLFLVTKLRLRTEGNVTGRDIARGLATPINFAMVGGLLCNLIGLGDVIKGSAFGDVLDEVLSFLGAPTGVLILITIGFGLNFSNIRWSETIKTILSRIVIFAVLGPIVYYLITRLMPGEPLYKYGIMMAFILPPSFVFSVYAKGEREESYVGSVLAVYTLLSLIGFSAVAWLAV